MMKLLIHENDSCYIKVCYIIFGMKTRTTSAKKKKVVRVLAQGSFDLIHPGHLFYLTQAKKQGDYLIVIVARDSTIKRIKHRKPIFPEKMRLEMIRSLKMVNEAVLGGKGNILDKVVELKPDVIVLGYDQDVSREELQTKLKARGLNCKIVRASAHQPGYYKSTKLKQKVVEFHQKIST